MADHRYQWLIECTPSGLTEQSECVFVKANRLEMQDGGLIFWAGKTDDEYVIAAFAVGQWTKAEITEAMMGFGNGMFSAKQK